MMTILEVFLRRIARRIAGMTENKGNGRKWDWASVDAALDTTEIWPISEYVRR